MNAIPVIGEVEKFVKLTVKNSQQVDVTVSGLGPRDAVSLLLFGLSYLIGNLFEERKIMPASMPAGKEKVI